MIPRLSLFRTSSSNTIDSSEDFICPICLEILLKPVTVSCGHTFCCECLAQCKQDDPKCPLCRSSYDPSKTQRAKELQKSISTLKAPCTGCKKVLLLSKLRSHHTHCSELPEGVVIPMAGGSASGVTCTGNDSSANIYFSAGNSGGSRHSYTGNGSSRFGGSGASSTGSSCTGSRVLRHSLRTASYSTSNDDDDFDDDDDAALMACGPRPPRPRYTFICPYGCESSGFDLKGLREHCNNEHYGNSVQVICPVCASMPWGNPTQHHFDFLSHLNLRHRFAYDSYMDTSNEDEALQKALEASLKEPNSSISDGGAIGGATPRRLHSSARVLRSST